jgi:hypothetical protein
MEETQKISCTNLIVTYHRQKHLESYKQVRTGSTQPREPREVN